MKITLCGTRGSVGRAGGTTVRYGGDTSSVAVQANDGHLVILDAGTGIANAHGSVPSGTKRVDILLTHLHMDHIQGLGFFGPLYASDIETHIWGPVSTTTGLAARLGRYLSPPLFPVRLRDLPSVHLHDLVPGTFEVAGFKVRADLVIHPGPTLGYRVEENGRRLAYIPDHEPALGRPELDDPRWLSGYSLAAGVDVLIHDAQYSDDGYAAKLGWGHSSYRHAMTMAKVAEVGRLVTFHHEPEHSDSRLDQLHDEARTSEPGLEIVPGLAGLTLEV